MEITPDEDTSSHGPTRVHSPLSPIRGISYPPLSPKSLKRGFAIQQQTSRNPPLIKSRQLAASAEIAPGRQITETLGPNITVIPDQQPDTEADQEHEQKQKRGGRFDRPDNRRYHTAGTIEDLKVIPLKYGSIYLDYYQFFLFRSKITKIPVYTSGLVGTSSLLFPETTCN